MAAELGALAAQRGTEARRLAAEAAELRDLAEQQVWQQANRLLKVEEELDDWQNWLFDAFGM